MPRTYFFISYLLLVIRLSGNRFRDGGIAIYACFIISNKWQHVCHLALDNFSSNSPNPVILGEFVLEVGETEPYRRVREFGVYLVQRDRIISPQNVPIVCITNRRSSDNYAKKFPNCFSVRPRSTGIEFCQGSGLAVHAGGAYRPAKSPGCIAAS